MFKVGKKHVLNLNIPETMFELHIISFIVVQLLPLYVNGEFMLFKAVVHTFLIICPSIATRLD